MEARAQYERKHAFIVKSTDIEKLWSLLESCIGFVSVQIRCADGIEREFDNKKELNSFDNPPAKRIIILSFNAHSENYHRFAELTFSEQSWPPIELRIKGTEQVVSKLHNDVRDVLDGMRPWYSMLTQPKSIFIIFFVFSLIIMSLLSHAYDKTINIKSDLNIALIILKFSILASILAGTGWIFYKIFLRWWPLGTFALGQGKDRYDFNEKVRWGIMIGFGVSFLASLVATFLI